MFTGIIEAIGRITRIEHRSGDARLQINSGRLDLSAARPGDSIAVNGVCLTALELTHDSFSADISAETLNRTVLGEFAVGVPVNLEQSLTPASRLGGHLVSGHVDGVGTVTRLFQEARSWRLYLRAPEALARYIAEKGSICVDGVSLTVNGVEGSEFDLNIVPHTLEHTIIGDYRVGHRVNLEVDVIARYLERLLTARAEGRDGLSVGLLRQHGFL